MILRRLAAFFYDLILILALLIIWTAVLILFNKGEVLPPCLWYRLSLSLIIACYFIGFWRHGGQTAGMKAWGLKIISTTSEQHTLSYFQSCSRFILLMLSTLFFGLGFFWLLFSKNQHTLYDRLSHIDMIYLFTHKKS